MINFMLLISRQGKTRLTKWYESYGSTKEKARVVREVTTTVLARPAKVRACGEAGRLAYDRERSRTSQNIYCLSLSLSLSPSLPPLKEHTSSKHFRHSFSIHKMCNFIEWRDKKIVYKRYASLFFVACVDKDDNELIVLEMIHLFVEVLDRYFGNVCELDVIFNFHKAYYIIDELFINGELQESSKKEVLSVCAQMDEMMDESNSKGKKKERRGF